MKALKHRHLAPPPSCLPVLLALAPALLLLLLTFTTRTAATPPNPLTRGSGLIPTPTSTATPTATPTLTPTPTPLPRCSLAWRIVSSPNPGSVYNHLFGVAAISAEDVWAVGYYGNGIRGETLTIHWDGTRWTHVPSPSPGTRTVILIGVEAASSNDVWAVGYRYSSGPTGGDETLVEHWDGNQWTVVPSPNVSTYTCWLRSVSAVTPNDVWAVGNYINAGGYNRTLVEHWDGQQWSIIPSPNVGTDNNQLWDVSTLSTNDVWAVGYYADIGRQFTLVEHWNGNQWSIVPSPNPPQAYGTALYGVAAISPNNVWAVGGYAGPIEGGTVVEHWGGTEWSIVPSPNAGPGTNHLLAVSAVSTTDVWAAGYYCCDTTGWATTLTEHWDGSQWYHVPSPNSGPDINSLAAIVAITGDDAWAVGEFRFPGGPWQALVEHYSIQCITPTPTPTLTPTPTGTSIPSTATATPTPSFTLTSTPTSTSPPTHTPTITPTTTIATASATATSTPTPTCTPTPCNMTFTDVHPTDYFYQAVRYLYCRAVISGYAGNTFRPYNLTTRSQLAKIAVLAFGLPSYTPPTPTFRDVPTTHTFYPYIETAYHSNLVSGYTCSSPIEPCPGLYFRPIGLVTRGQLSKIVVLAANWTLIDPSNPTFQDVPPASPFYRYIETAHTHAIISGYTCGPSSPSPSCLEFRPSNPATRGQISKIVHLAITAPSP